MRMRKPIWKMQTRKRTVSKNNPSESDKNFLDICFDLDIIRKCATRYGEFVRPFAGRQMERAVIQNHVLNNIFTGGETECLHLTS